MKLSIIALCFLLLFGSSCAMFTNIPVGQKVVFIKAATRTGIYLGLTKMIEDEEQRQIAATILKQDIAMNVLTLLDQNDVQISAANRELLLAKIPIELRPFINDALEIFHSYLTEAELTNNLDENGIRLFKAFFQGIVEGCDLVIQLRLNLSI